jgi:metal-sulfur cluster biosynthetic enzyme
MTTEAEVRAALAEVIHPSFGLSLIALNMVRTVRVSDTAIEVDLVMNCPGCPAGETALALVRQKIEALGVSTVWLNVLPQSWAPPWE